LPDYNLGLIRLSRWRSLAALGVSVASVSPVIRDCERAAVRGLYRASTSLPALSADAIAAEKRKQEIAQVRDYYAQLHRVDTVAFRIRVANRADCKAAVSAQIGLYAVTPQSLPGKYRTFSSEALNLNSSKPTVISVVDGSPAALAGIATGDEIIALNGETIPLTDTPGWIGGTLQQNGERPVAVALRRDGVEQTRMMQPVIACAIPIDLATNPVPNAFTDYKRIVIQSGILRLTRTDADLAVIIGHELAHVNMGHYGKKVQNALLGAFGGAAVDGAFLLGGMYTGGTFSKHFELAGLRAFSVGFEREADYVGAYYAARAGYNVSAAENVWRAIALESPASMRLATTHPTTPERFVQMQNVAAEIADKKRRQLPLLPELKVTQVDAEPAAASEHNY
jgi:Zn-dependent protease with chaperone function